MRLLDIELSQPLPTLSACDAQRGQRYRRVSALVRLHTQPLGVIELDVPEDGLEAQAYAVHIWHAFRQAIRDHLRQDGLPEAEGLDAAGLPSLSAPRCEQARDQFMSRAPMISVVVPTRDRVEELSACLDSLLELKYPRDEIIVVDNAPGTPATADLVRRRYGHLPQVRYVREDRPGSQWARNSSLRLVRGDIVAFIDDDAIADPYWLTHLAMAFETADRVACVTGLALPAELETQAQCWFEQFGGFNKGRAFRRRIHNLTTHRMPDPLFPYLAGVFGAGVNMAFKADVFRDLGGFDPAFVNGQDSEAFLRIILKGYTLVYEPTAVVRHYHRRDYASLRNQLHRYGIACTAVLTKCVTDNPWRLLELLGKLPHAMVYLMNPRSARNEHKRDYPRELLWREMTGMLIGPPAYVRRRRQANRIIKQFGPLSLYLDSRQFMSADPFVQSLPQPKQL